MTTSCLLVCYSVYQLLYGLPVYLKHVISISQAANPGKNRFKKQKITLKTRSDNYARSYNMGNLSAASIIKKIAQHLVRASLARVQEGLLMKQLPMK